MKKAIILCFSMIIILSNSFIQSASAYTYGDPNKEELAEVYKEMMIELSETPPDFTTAEKHFETIKEEIDMHMGPEPGSIIADNLQNEEKEQAVSNMDKLLVLNIARRLEGVTTNFEEFDTSKKLMAKAFATYEALSPKVEGADAELDGEIRTEFETALEALGNPGLFGVGEKEADMDRFKEAKESILTSLQDRFELESLDVGHFSESASEAEDNVKNRDWTDVSNLKNWIPLLLIVGVIGAVVFITIRRKKK
ncbi:hypothetical protein V1502_02100 [Bacillus sp. SCS-153A]|uniref:hypothetical protein n=1 Tax=Rossellomorea sedimentorum TaxID=3115294 RepID=UPI003906833F